MVQNCYMALVLERKIESRRSTKAETCRPDAFYALLFESSNDFINGLYPAGLTMLSDPCIAIEGGVVEVDDGVAV